MKQLKYKDEEGNWQSMYEVYIPDPFNGYDYVDMGEAGIWTKYPLGITEWNEEALDKILYFAWGETQGYTKSQVPSDKQFSWGDYKFGGRLEGTIHPSKYNNTDKLTTLELEDDAVHASMGDNWRIPTKDEFQELYNLCDKKEVTDYNGVSGLNGKLFTLKSDSSKQMFFPYIGDYNEGSIYGEGTFSSCWSSNGSIYNAYYMSCNKYYTGTDSRYRNQGSFLLGILDTSSK